MSIVTTLAKMFVVLVQLGILIHFSIYGLHSIKLRVLVVFKKGSKPTGHFVNFLAKSEMKCNYSSSFGVSSNFGGGLSLEKCQFA